MGRLYKVFTLAVVLCGGHAFAQGGHPNIEKTEPGASASLVTAGCTNYVGNIRVSIPMNHRGTFYLGANSRASYCGNFYSSGTFRVGPTDSCRAVWLKYGSMLVCR